MKTATFEIKKAGKWSKVRATSIKALDSWATANNISKWRMTGMQSIEQTAANQNLEIVA